MAATRVQVWEEQAIIPTYPAAAPEKSPLFLENRAYQGSSGRVYPLPVTEKISDEKEDVAYHAIYLENEYLKVMILPEIGGRIQRAYDKTNAPAPPAVYLFSGRLFLSGARGRFCHSLCQ